MENHYINWNMKFRMGTEVDISATRLHTPQPGRIFLIELQGLLVEDDAVGFPGLFEGDSTAAHQVLGGAGVYLAIRLVQFESGKRPVRSIQRSAKARAPS